MHSGGHKSETQFLGDSKAQMLSQIYFMMTEEQTASFLENFSVITYQALVQECERIEDALMMIDAPPTTHDDKGAKEVASKQHSMCTPINITTHCSSH